MLGADNVLAALRVKLKVFKGHGGYKKVPISKAVNMIGKQPSGARWIDTNKGDAATPEYVSRLVAK